MLTSCYICRQWRELTISAEPRVPRVLGERTDRHAHAGVAHAAVLVLRPAAGHRTAHRCSRVLQGAGRTAGVS